MLKASEDAPHSLEDDAEIWGFRYLFGVPIQRIITFWGLCWGPLILRNYHIHWETVRVLHEKSSKKVQHAGMKVAPLRLRRGGTLVQSPALSSVCPIDYPVELMILIRALR